MISVMQGEQEVAGSWLRLWVMSSICSSYWGILLDGCISHLHLRETLVQTRDDVYVVRLIRNWIISIPGPSRISNNCLSDLIPHLMI